MYKNYEEFNACKAKCRDCSVGLVYDRVVLSDGCINPSVIVMGEAPGRDEVEQGKPFVGKAGKLLRATLSEFGFDLETNTLISNVMPCRPENNKFPTDRELVKNCYMKWLHEEIVLTDVKFLLLFGAQPLKYLLGKTGITKLRGMWYKLPSNENVKCLPTFHPSYVQRKEHMTEGEQIKQSFRNDIEKMATTLGFNK